MEYDLHAKAHGKILWLGGYSILERPNIGYVTTVDAGVHAYLSSINTDEIRIIAPDFNIDVNGTVDKKSGELKIDTLPELKLVKTAIQVALYYAVSEGVPVSGFVLRTENDPAFSYNVSNGKIGASKSGLGSSAAVTSAVIGALMTHFGLDLDKDDALHKLAQVAHAMATGKIGSGIDIAATIYGDIVYSRYSPEIVKAIPQDFTVEEISKVVRSRWDYSIKQLDLPQAFDFAVANFVGSSAITTAMVGGFNEFKNSDPDSYFKIIRSMNEENSKAIKALQKISDGGGADTDLENFRKAFDKGRKFAKTLGVRSNIDIETDEITDIIDKTVNAGAFVAKSPGSGGYDSIAALFLANGNKSAYDNTINFWKTNERLQPIKLEKNSKGIEIVHKKR